MCRSQQTWASRNVKIECYYFIPSNKGMLGSNLTWANVDFIILLKGRKLHNCPWKKKSQNKYIEHKMQVTKRRRGGGCLWKRREGRNFQEGREPLIIETLLHISWGKLDDFGIDERIAKTFTTCLSLSS